MTDRTFKNESEAVERRPLITFRIDGKDYPFTGAESLTMDEAILLFDYSDVTIDQLRNVRGFNPRVVKAFMHIAMARREPGRPDESIRKILGELNADDVAQAFLDITKGEKKADERPPESAPSSGNESSTPPGANETSSGDNGANGGGLPPDSSKDVSTGHPLSGTGAESGRATSEG